MSMTLGELELAGYGERFIRAFESIRRALSLYPAAHPIVKVQLQRLKLAMSILPGKYTIKIAKLIKSNSRSKKVLSC